MLKSLNWHEDRREDFFPADPSYFTAEIRNSEAAQGEYKDLENKLKKMHTALNKSIPFFSTRYQVNTVDNKNVPSRHMVLFQRCKNVVDASKQRCIEVKTTSCSYWIVD